MSLLELRQLSFAYDKTPVLENLSYQFESGKVYAIVGKSGAGKTTLLSLLAGLASPTSGQILFQGNDIGAGDKYEFRRKHAGVVFQSYNLLTKLTAVENVLLSMEIAGVHGANKKETAYGLLDKMGLTREEADRRILKLSGGQQQRVAIARALSFNPDIILADEPTGNLDLETQTEIVSILRNLANEGKCVIVVTHAQDIAKQADYIYALRQGKSVATITA